MFSRRDSRFHRRKVSLSSLATPLGGRVGATTLVTTERQQAKADSHSMRTHQANNPPSKGKRPSWALLRTRRFQQRRVIHSVRSHGVIGPGVRAAGVSTRVVKRWLNSDPSFAGRFEEALFAYRDTIKERLLDRASAGDGPTLRFVASRLIPEEFGPPGYRRARQAAEALRDPWSSSGNPRQMSPFEFQAHLNK